MTERLIYAALGAALAAAGIAWLVLRSNAAGVADYQPAPAVVHGDGSVTLAKAVASAPVKRTAATYPSGSKVTRQIDAVLQPRASECASIVAHVDLTQTDDGATRVTVSAEGATVEGGQDLILTPTPERKQWIVGAGVMAGKPSLAAGRTVGPVKIVGAVAGTAPHNLTGAAWIMIEF